MLILFLNILISFSISPIFVYWSPFFKSFNNNIWILGYIWILINISNGIGNSIIRYISGKVQRNNVLKIALIGSAFAIFISATANSFAVALIFFLIFEIIYGIINPCLSAYFNDYLEDETRTTLLSINSMFGKLGNFLSLMLMGYLGDAISMNFTWIIAGIVLMFTFLFAFYLKTDEEQDIMLNEEC